MTSSIAAWAAIVLAGASPAPRQDSGGRDASELRMDGRAQGTTYRVRAFSSRALSPQARRAVESRVEDLLHRIDALMSAWREDSEIERLNRTPAGVPFTLSPENAWLLGRARKLWRLSGGAFDPTIGRSIRLWGFGGAPRRSEPPTDAEIDAARADGGFQNLDLHGRVAEKRRAGLAVDLSGIAQGYSVDRVYELLREAGFERLLVEIGGEVRAGAPPPGEAAWRVGIEDPRGDGLGPTLALVRASVSTSGDYRNNFEADGMRYSHILDPRNGRPIETGVAAATLVAPDCTTSDALAKTLMIMGPRRALAFVEEHPALSCRLLVRDGASFRDVRSPGFARWVR